MPLLNDNPFARDDSLEIASVLGSNQGKVYDNDFEILSTMRYMPPPKGESLSEGSFYLLKLHHQRIQYTLKFFQFGMNISYDYLFDELKSAVKDLDRTSDYKLRVLIHRTRQLKIEAYEIPKKADLIGVVSTPPPKSEHFRIFMDKEPTFAGAFTSFKTTQRDHYTAARNRSLHPELQREDGKSQEVLLWNERDQITEGSITNIAVLRGGYWVTPRLESGALCGVMRAHLLQEGLITEGIVPRDAMSEGDLILLFNAVQGCNLGVLEFADYVPPTPRIPSESVIESEALPDQSEGEEGEYDKEDEEDE